jgi:hypothetical protein
MEHVLYGDYYSNHDVNQVVDFLVDNKYEEIHRFKHVSPKIEEIIFKKSKELKKTSLGMM